MQSFLFCAAAMIRCYLRWNCFPKNNAYRNRQYYCLPYRKVLQCGKLRESVSARKNKHQSSSFLRYQVAGIKDVYDSYIELLTAMVAASPPSAVWHHRSFGRSLTTDTKIYSAIAIIRIAASNLGNESLAHTGASLWYLPSCAPFCWWAIANIS